MDTMTCPQCGFPVSALQDGMCADCCRYINPGASPDPADEHDYSDYDYPEDDHWCHYCGGEGWGIVGTDWDCDDGINGPYPGEVQQCPCCNGSGEAKDCMFW